MIEKVIEQFNLQVLSMNEVENSHSSTVFQCHLANGEIVFVKIPYTKVKYEREREAYAILNGRVSIPKMLDDWSGDDECPGAFLLSSLKGQPLHTNTTPDIAYQVGILHASLHNIQPPINKKLTSIQNEFTTWIAFIRRQFYSFAEDVKEVIRQELYQLAMVKFEKMQEKLPPPDGPSFIHMDFRPANIIVDDNCVASVIDFESVRFGSTEVDFTKIHRDFLQFQPDFMQAYRDGYESIRPMIDLDVVLPFYQFTDAFNSIGWCKRRGLEKNARFLKQNLILLEKHLL